MLLTVVLIRPIISFPSSTPSFQAYKKKRKGCCGKDLQKRKVYKPFFSANSSHSSLSFSSLEPRADPENELGGGQFRGSPAGSRGGGPVEGLGDEVPQKLTTFRS